MPPTELSNLSIASRVYLLFGVRLRKTHSKYAGQRCSPRSPRVPERLHPVPGTLEPLPDASPLLPPLAPDDPRFPVL